MNAPPWQPRSLWPQIQRWFQRWGTQRVRTPTVLQMEMVECGAAALGIVLSHFGRIVPLAELRRECGVSRDGSKASNVIKAARRYGAEAQGFKVELEAIRQMPLPFIVFWQFNHFLVVEGFSRRRVYLNDPATGPRWVSWQEFDEGFTGVVLTIQPGEGFERRGRKPSTLAALGRRLRGTSGALIYCLCAGLLLALLGLAVPVFSQIFIDQILIQGRESWLRPLLWTLVIVALLQGLITQLQLRYLRRMQIKLAVTLSGQFLWHLLRLPNSFYTQRYAGEISYRLRLNDKVAQVLSGQLATTVISAVMVLIYVGVMLGYDLLLTGIGMGIVALNILALRWVARRRVDTNLRLVQDQGRRVSTEIGGLQGIETLKAGGLESDFFSRWSGYYTKVLNEEQQLIVSNHSLGSLPPLLSAIAVTSILVIGGLRVMEGALSIGMVIAFQGLMTNLLQPISRLVQFGSVLQELEGDLNRLEDVLQNPTLDADRDRTGLSQSIPAQPKLQGALELDQVSFGYSPIDPPLIQEFSLQIDPGQRVALVGGSGSGKTTVVRLVAGLYEPWQGQIRLDGQPRDQIPSLVLTHSLSMVEQDTLLFGGSVRDNLTLWDTTIPDEDLVRACQDAEIHTTIMTQLGSYRAALMEGGVNFSGGQRQQLEIARALVTNPSIVILDEATSALDPETERRVDRNLRRRGCTCLIVAHRLSTIRDCDQILVLERGRILERGTHEHLWDLGGTYAQLIQSEGLE